MLTNDDEIIKKEALVNYQNKIRNLLHNEKISKNAIANGLKILIEETMRIQYKLLPSSFICLLEGSNNIIRKRRQLEKIIQIFYIKNIKNKISIAFGIWKLYLLSKLSQLNYFLNCKKAATYLIIEWMNKVRKKRLKSVFKRYHLTIFLKKGS